MTTKFTKEWIDMARRSITEPGVERYICIPVQEEMLDQIERLQARVQELEAELELLREPECIWTRSETSQWYWKTECGDWFDDGSYAYCSCGKRIKYVEVE